MELSQKVGEIKMNTEHRLSLVENKLNNLIGNRESVLTSNTMGEGNNQFPPY